MADFDKIINCVSKETFEVKIKGLKESLKTNKSSVNVFVEEEFFHRVKNYLKVVTERELDSAPSIKTPELSRGEINTIKPKKEGICEWEVINHRRERSCTSRNAL